ncbi:hypothetical protein [Stappia sp.]|uniref:hypothetical protein n=1 Tax=Stappia sp. TaxID=1870903 RepID=UPI003C7CD3F7
MTALPSANRTFPDNSLPVPGRSQKAVLLKVSASGETYFHKGKTHQVETDSGRTVVVAETSFFEGDAHRFGSLSEAQAEADWLNARGIGGAPWHAIEVPA